LRQVKAGVLAPASNDFPSIGEVTMQLWKDLLSTDVGLMSLAVIVFMLGMGGFYVRYFLRHMQEDSAQHPPKG
jgi:hypothetical protein